MPSPFPGMDPYLDHPDYWPEVHHWLITLIAETLVPQVRPKYRVAIEKRIYEVNPLETGGNGNSLLVGIPVTFSETGLASTSLSQPSTRMSPERSRRGRLRIPDVSVHRQSAQAKITTAASEVSPHQPQTVTLPMTEQVKQAYLEIREMQTGQVVTAIEILSPVNKRSGEGRNTYIQRRQRILSSLTHLVEIDLLRGWQPMPILNAPATSDYRILVSPSDRRPSADLYLIDLQQPLPTVPIPLLRQDEPAVLEIQILLNAVYDRGGFDYVVDYSHELSPPLANDKQDWVTDLLAEKQLKN